MRSSLWLLEGTAAGHPVQGGLVFFSFWVLLGSSGVPSRGHVD